MAMRKMRGSSRIIMPVVHVPRPVKTDSTRDIVSDVNSDSRVVREGNGAIPVHNIYEDESVERSSP